MLLARRLHAGGATDQKYAILIASTYGEGDPPDPVQPFYEQLCVEHFPLLQDLSFAVLALWRFAL